MKFLFSLPFNFYPLRFLSVQCVKFNMKVDDKHTSNLYMKLCFTSTLESMATD
jgi:hypothetical protein